MVPAGVTDGHGRRSSTRREIPSVVLTAGAVQAQLHAHDLLRLIERKAVIAESIGEPDAMLCWPQAAAEATVVADLVEDLPRDALALIGDPSDPGVQAVVSGWELESLTWWVLDLPH